MAGYWVHLLFAVWFIATLIGVYLITFWIDAQLLNIGWEGAALTMILLCALVGLLDIVFLGIVTIEWMACGVALHVLVLLVTSTFHERIQRAVGYPYRR